MNTTTIEPAPGDALASIRTETEKTRRSRAGLLERQAQMRDRRNDLIRRREQAEQEYRAMQLATGADAGAAFTSSLDAETEAANRELGVISRAIEITDEALARLRGEHLAYARNHAPPEYGKAVTRVCLALLELQAALDAKAATMQQIYDRGLIEGLPRILGIHPDFWRHIKVGGKFYVDEAKSAGYFDPRDAGAITCGQQKPPTQKKGETQ